MLLHQAVAQPKIRQDSEWDTIQGIYTWEQNIAHEIVV